MFTWPIRIYYEDTDAGGVVYHSQYLNFLERARTEWLRSLGLEQTSLRSELGVLFVVHRLRVDYKKSAKFNDALEIKSIITTLSFASVEFEQKIYRGQTLLINATVKVACVDAINLNPVAIPITIKDKMRALM
jgi:acyl-CoA thioester hydrolase